MARTISIGAQGFEAIRANGYFYVDKTDFVRSWWHSGDSVTLICRPRRFGKTLNLDTVRCFLSTEFAGRGEELFGDLAVWDDPQMRTLQGTVPVISLSFAGCKGESFHVQQLRMCEQLAQAWSRHRHEIDLDQLTDYERELVSGMQPAVQPELAATSLQRLCTLLHASTGKDAVVLLDEYDTPMQEAWLGGWWDEAVEFQRALFNNTFKTNPHLARGMITGVTRVSRESIFSDLNNLVVVTTTTPAYQTDFGFTEAEVWDALEEFGMSDQRELVRRLYDGFVFDGERDIYNPWSITNFLKYREPRAYWANTSGNGLISSVVRTSDIQMKREFERLLTGGTVTKTIHEEVVFSELATVTNAAWALLLAGGYVKALSHFIDPEYPDENTCELQLTNLEVRSCFDQMVKGWFSADSMAYSQFVHALLDGDIEGMTRELADVLIACMSSFDGAKRTAESQPERFYHGLVLGLLVELRRRYAVESNRESGWGRYDVMLVPNDGASGSDPAIVIEFKVFDPKRETTLEDTITRAHEQIEDKAYATTLEERGFTPERIHTYGMAFRGKECLVG